MTVQRAPGITGTTETPTPQTCPPNTSNSPKFTIEGEGWGSINSETIECIGFVALRVFLALGAIGLMVAGYPITIPLGVLLFLAVACTLPRAKDRDMGEIEDLLTNSNQILKKLDKLEKQIKQENRTLDKLAASMTERQPVVDKIDKLMKRKQQASDELDKLAKTLK